MWHRKRKELGLALSALLVVGAGTLLITADWGGNNNAVTGEASGPRRARTATPAAEPEVTKRRARQNSRPEESSRRKVRPPRHRTTNERTKRVEHGKRVKKIAKKRPSAA